MSIGVGRNLPVQSGLTPGTGFPTVNSQGITTALRLLLAADIPSLLSTKISDFSTAADARVAAAVGVSVQAYDADLVTIAALAPSDGAFLRRTSSAWVGATLLAADIPTLTLSKISDAGTMASQAASAVAITGGTINGAVIGGVTPAAGTFTALRANTTLAFNTATFGTNNKFLVNPYLTVDNLATVMITPTAATNKGLVIQGYTSQSANAVEVQNSSGVVKAALDPYGNLLLGGWNEASIPTLSGYLVAKLNSGGVDRGFIEFSTPGNQPGILFWDATRTTAARFNLAFDAANNVFNLSAGTLSNTKVVIGNSFAAASAPLTVYANDAVTAAVTDVAILDHSTSGTPAAVYGTGLHFKGQSSTTVSRSMGRVRTQWADPTDVSRSARLIFSTFSNSGEFDQISMNATAITFLNTLNATTITLSGAISGTTFSGTTVTASTKLVSPIWSPASDSTTALKITKADGSTAVLTVDTTNSNVSMAGILTLAGRLIFPSTGNLIDSGGNGLLSRSSSTYSWQSASAGAVFMQWKDNGGNVIAALDNAGIYTVTGRDAATAAVTDVGILDHLTSGTPAASYGTGLAFKGQSSTTVSRSMGRVRTEWTTATDASRASKMVLSTYAIGVETDAVTILSDGSVGIGITSSLAGKLHVAANGPADAIFERATSDANSNDLNLYKTRGTLSSKTIVSNNDSVGRAIWRAYDGGSYRGLAAIEAFVDGTPGASDMPGRLVFSTATDGGIVLTERIRIDNVGLVGIGNITPTKMLDVNSDSIRVRTAKTPASAAATGDQGEIAWDTSFIYICTATNTWKRVAIATW